MHNLRECPESQKEVDHMDEKDCKIQQLKERIDKLLKLVESLEEAKKTLEQDVNDLVARIKELEQRLS